MLRSYRLAIVAALGCLILGQSEQGRATDNQHRHKQAAAQPQTPPKPSDTPATKSAQEQCYAGSEIGVSCGGVVAKATVDQARDADKQAATVWWQFGVSAATLAAAAAAAVFAWSAAHHTKRSADAAVEARRGADVALAIAERNAKAATSAVSIAQENGERELRAYVMVENITYRDFVINLKPWFTVAFKNFGRTPASDVAMYGTVSIYPIDVAQDQLEVVIRNDTSKAPLGPGAGNEITAIFPGPIVQQVVDDFAAGRTNIYAYGRIIYRDAFGESRVTKYRFVAKGGTRNVDFVVAAEGNSYT